MSHMRSSGVFQSGLGGRNIEERLRAVAQERGGFGADLPFMAPAKIKQARENLGIPPVPYGGKDIGIRQTVVAQTLNQEGFMHYGEPSLKHYRLTVGVSDPSDAVGPITPGTTTGGIGLRIYVYGTMQNEVLPARVAYIQAGDARPIYVSGTSIKATATNDTSYDMIVNAALDEVAPGFSDFWDWVQFTSWPATGNALTIPAFCRSFTVYTAPGGAAPTLNAYAPGGALVYQTALSTPSSGAIDRVPGWYYVLTGGTATTTVYYYCAG